MKNPYESGLNTACENQRFSQVCGHLTFFFPVLNWEKKCGGRRTWLRYWHIHSRGSLRHRGNGRGDEQTGFILKNG